MTDPLPEAQIQIKETKPLADCAMSKPDSASAEDTFEIGSRISRGRGLDLEGAKGRLRVTASRSVGWNIADLDRNRYLQRQKDSRVVREQRSAGLSLDLFIRFQSRCGWSYFASASTGIDPTVGLALCHRCHHGAVGCAAHRSLRVLMALSCRNQRQGSGP